MTRAFHNVRKVKPVGALLLALATGSLGGCTGGLPAKPATPSDQFVVESVRLSHQVTFVSNEAAMSPGASDSLAAFLDEVDPDGKAEIYLDAAGPFQNDRLDAVADILAAQGRTASGTGGAVASDLGVTVTVADDILLPASCMDHDQWPDPSLPPSSCTTALTLVRMMEDPDDLLRGRELGPASSASAAAAVARHRDSKAASAAGERPASAGETQQLPPPSSPVQDASY